VVESWLRPEWSPPRPGPAEAQQRHSCSVEGEPTTDKTSPRPPRPPPARHPRSAMAMLETRMARRALKRDRASSRPRATRPPTWAMCRHRQLAQIKRSLGCSWHPVPTSPIAHTSVGGGVNPAERSPRSFSTPPERIPAPAFDMRLSSALNSGDVITIRPHVAGTSSGPKACQNA